MVIQTTKSASMTRRLIIIGVVAIMVLSFIPTILSGFASRQVAAASYYLTEEYNPQQALSHYETALRFDSTHKEALYNAARLYGMLGHYTKASEVIERYTQEYPEEKRIHYIAGLTYAFQKDLSRAEEEFEQFVASGEARWPGYLDLAWVNFQQGDFDEAEALLTEAQLRFGSNAWLNASLGAVYLAQEENEKAQEVLEHAQVQARLITTDEWANNYSFNDPREFQSGIEHMQSVIAANLASARGTPDVVSVARALDSLFVGVSPEGYTKGIAVAACGDSCTSSPCFSQPNSCGQVVTGVQQTCTQGFSTQSTTGLCSVTKAPDPDGYGNACKSTNACGQSVSGTIDCDGSCKIATTACTVFAPTISSGNCTAGELRTFNLTATHPLGAQVRYGIDWDNNGTVDEVTSYVPSDVTHNVAHVFDEGSQSIRVRVEDASGLQSAFVSHAFVCAPSTQANDTTDDGLGGFGGEHNNTDNSGNGTGISNGGIRATPNIVRVGTVTTLLWDTEGVESCTVHGTNGDRFTGISGNRSSGPITERTVFTLSCDAGEVTDSAAVNVLPTYQEI